MHLDLTNGRPIKCSKCGSTNAVKPVNSRDIEIKCGDCGHTKLTQEAQRRDAEREFGEARIYGWSHEKDQDPTF